MSDSQTFMKLAEKALDKIPNATETKTFKLLDHMICDFLAPVASRLRDRALIHSQPNAVSYEIFSQQIFEKVSAIDEEKLTEPEPQVIGQAIDDSIYCHQHEELRSMFSSLIANSCNIDYLKIIHPSFSSTLKCMSPYDAVLFKRISEHFTATTEAIPAATYLVLTKDSNTYELLHDCIVFTDEFFSDFDMQSLSISALNQLGVITYTPPVLDIVDKKFIDNDFYKSLEKQYKGSNSFPVVRFTQICLTPYGVSLINACSTPPLLNEQTP